MPADSPRCEILPLPNHEVSFRVDGAEKTRWHSGGKYPRPFFYPLLGASGESVTRMGHPGAPNHDHHRSVWFAHFKVLGINFWNDATEAVIRQREWLCYEDGDDEAVMAVLLDWSDGHDPKPLLTQELIASIRPGDGKDFFLDLQSRFLPTAQSLEFEKTNFGFLAVRMAKRLSGHFGTGKISDSEGRVGEKAIFGNAARWMDYAGESHEGVTYFDHPDNPGFPNRWHVREDGWMGAAICHDGPVTTTKKEPLLVRHLLHVHSSQVTPEGAKAVEADFHGRPAREVVKSSKPHLTNEIR